MMNVNEKEPLNFCSGFLKIFKGMLKTRSVSVRQTKLQNEEPFHKSSIHVDILCLEFLILLPFSEWFGQSVLC